MAIKKITINLVTINLWLMGALLFLLPFEAYPFLRLYGLEIRPSHIIAIVFVFINLPKLWQNKNRLLQNPWIFLVIFLLIAGTSLLYNGPNKAGILTLGLYIFEFLLALTVSVNIQKTNLKTIRDIILVSSILLVVFGLWQFFADSYGLSQTYTLLDSRYIHGVFGYPRIHGLSLEPLFFANYLFIPLCLSLLSWLLEKRVQFFCLTILFSTAICLTVSRSAWVGLSLVFCITIIMLVIQKNYKMALKTLGSIIFAIAVAVVLMATSMSIIHNKTTAVTVAPAAQSQFVPTNQNTSTMARSVAWKIAAKQFFVNPLIGIGPSNIQKVIQTKLTAEQSVSAGNFKSNNVYLEILSENGFLGGLSLLGFVIGVAYLVLRSSKKNLAKDQTIWLYGVCLMVIAFAMQWSVVSNLAVTHTWIMIGILVGITGASKISLVEDIYKKLRRFVWLKQNKLALIISVFVMAYYLVFEFLLYRKFQFPMLDLGLFNRHMFGLTRLNLDVNPLKGYNLLGDHSHFFLLPLLPLYMLWQNPAFLLIIQALFIVLSGWPIYLIAKKYSPSAKLAALWLLPYFMFFGFWSALAYPFHDSAAAVLPLAWVLYLLLVSKNYKYLCISLAALILFREDMPLVAIMVGLYIVVIERKYLLGVAIATISSLYFFWVTKLWLPSFGPNYGYQKTPFGSSLTDSLIAVFTQPLNVIKTFFTPLEKLQNQLAMLVSFGGFSIFALEVLILLLPLWLGRFLSVETWRWGSLEHYTASQAPILAAASIIGLYRLIQYLHQRYGVKKELAYKIAIGVTIVLAFVLNFVMHQNGILKPLALKFYKLSASEQSAQQAIKVIPATASVGAQSAFPQLSSRDQIYNLPLPAGAQPEYIVLSPKLEKWPFLNEAAVIEYKSQLETNGYLQVFSQNDVYVLKKANE